MTEFTAIAEHYLRPFNEADAGRRRELIEQLYVPDARFADPLAEAVGTDEIDAFHAAAQEQLAGMRFTLAGPVDGHHRSARFQWHATAPGADEPTVVGFDVLELAEDGRIQAVHGFFDKLPGPEQ